MVSTPDRHSNKIKMYSRASDPSMGSSPRSPKRPASARLSRSLSRPFPHSFSMVARPSSELVGSDFMVSTHRVSVRGVQVSVSPAATEELTQLVVDHLGRDDASKTALTSYAQLMKRKYATPASKEAHAVSLATIDAMSASPRSRVDNLDVSERSLQFMRVQRGPVGAGRYLSATRNAGVGYFCFPFVAISLIIKLVKARRAIQKRRDDAKCSLVFKLTSYHLKSLVLERWSKSFKAERWLQRTTLKHILHKWSAVAARQRWSRHALGVKLEHVIVQQYRLKRVFDVWRVVSWMAKYLDRHFLTIRNFDFEEGEISGANHKSLPYLQVTDLTVSDMDRIERSVEHAFVERFGRSARTGGRVTSSVQAAVVLPEAIRHVWDQVFTRKHWEERSVDDGMDAYALVGSDGRLGFRGRVTSELAAAQNAARAHFFLIVPSVWRRWRFYVKGSKQMRGVSAAGAKYFATKTRFRILKECLRKWHESQQIAFAQTSFAVRLKHSVLIQWRKRLHENIQGSNLVAIADSTYRERQSRRLMATWKDAMRRRVMLECLGSMQALLNRRQMLSVVYSWQALYYLRRASERDCEVEQKRAFDARQRTTETGDLLLVRANTSPSVTVRHTSGFDSDGAFADSLAEVARINALQIKAFVSWRKLAQDSERYRMFTNHQVDTCGRLLALRAFCVWRARGCISWLSLSPNEGGDGPLSPSGLGDRVPFPIGRLPLVDLGGYYSKKASMLLNNQRASASSDILDSTSPSALSQRASGTPLSPGLGGSQSPGSSHLLGGTTSSLVHQTVPGGNAERITCVNPNVSLFPPFAWPAARAAVSAYLTLLLPSEGQRQTTSVTFSESPASPLARSIKSPGHLPLDGTGSPSSSIRRGAGDSGPFQPVALSRSLPSVGVASANIVAFGCIPGLTSSSLNRNSGDLFPQLDLRFVSQMVTIDEGLNFGSRREPQTPLGPPRNGRLGRSASNGERSGMAGSMSQQHFFQSTPISPSLHHAGESDTFFSSALSAVLLMLQGGGVNGIRGDLLLLKARLLSAQYRAFIRFNERPPTGDLGMSAIIEVPNPLTNISHLARISRKMYREELAGIRMVPVDPSPDEVNRHVSSPRIMSPQANVRSISPSVVGGIPMTPISISLTSPNNTNYHRARSVTIAETPSKSIPRVHSPVRRESSAASLSHGVLSPRVSYAVGNEELVISSPPQNVTSQVRQHRRGTSVEGVPFEEGDGAQRTRLRSESSLHSKTSRSDPLLVANASRRRERRGVFSRFVQQRIGFSFVVMGIAVQAARKRRSVSTLVYGTRHKSSAQMVRPWWESLGLRFLEGEGGSVAPQRPSGYDRHEESLSVLGSHPTSQLLLGAYSNASALEAGLVDRILAEQIRIEDGRRSRRDWLFGGGNRSALNSSPAVQSATTDYFVGNAPKLFGSLMSSLRNFLLDAARFEGSAEERLRVAFLTKHPEYLPLYGAGRSDRSGSQRSSSDSFRQLSVVEDPDRIRDLCKMVLQQLYDGVIDSRAHMWNPILSPNIEYCERNYKKVLKVNPAVLERVELERGQWASIQMRAMIAAGRGSDEYHVFGAAPIPSNVDGGINYQRLEMVDKQGAFSHYFRSVASGFLVSEMVQLLMTTEATRKARNPAPNHASDTPLPAVLDTTALPKRGSAGEEVGGNRSILMFTEAMNSLIKYNRDLTIRTRMRSTFLIRRYTLAAAATRFVQSMVLGNENGMNGSVTRPLSASPPPKSFPHGTSARPASRSSGQIAPMISEVPHYTPFDALTGSRIAPINPTKIAWSMESPQFRRRQFGQFGHYTIRTARQAEQQQREEEATYERVLERARRAARLEARIANAKGSEAARLRMKGRKSRVGGAATGASALPFLNTLLERYRPGASGPPRIVSDRLAYAREDSEDGSSDWDSSSSDNGDELAIPSFSIITPTMPQAKVRKLVTVRKGAAQGLGDTPEDLEELKKTNPRMYYHQLYTARNAGSVVKKRNQMMDLFTGASKASGNRVRTIGLNAQHIALEVAIKWRLRVESRMFAKRKEKRGDLDSRSRKRKAADEDDLHGPDETPDSRYPFTSPKMKFLFLS